MKLSPYDDLVLSTENEIIAISSTKVDYVCMLPVKDEIVAIFWWWLGTVF